MNPLSSDGVLSAWEAGRRQPPVERALTLLACATGKDPAEFGPLSMGQRNTRLLELRRRLFGDSLDAWLECGACRQKLEFTASVSGLLEQEGAREQNVRIEDRGRRFVLRFPTSDDLMALRADGSPLALVERCLIAGDATQLDEELSNMAAARVVEADHLAEVQIDSRCPGCGVTCQGILDVGEFLWMEIQAHAMALLREVHTLASAYGWSETHILDLSPIRRAAYLNMILDT